MGNRVIPYGLSDLYMDSDVGPRFSWAIYRHKRAQTKYGLLGGPAAQ
jgi:hypothetical protein